MKEYIDKILTVVGTIFIFVGLIFGIVSFYSIDSQTYKNAEKVFKELPDNQIAEATYNAAHQLYLSEVTYALSVLFGGIITGLLFIGFARVIELLKEKNKNENDTIQVLNKINSRLNKSDLNL